MALIRKKQDRDILFPQKVGMFGYNCRIGKCDFIKTGEYEPHQLLFGIGFSVPCVIILVSYSIIWYHVRASTKLLNQLGYVRLMS